jgi:E3 ubiquitin-protein ligase ZNF598
MLLLRFNCPDPSCDVACRNWSALKAHVKTAHHRYLCSLCTQHKKVFTHEHILYTSRELTTHFATGDPIKDISLTGFTGHPKCKFCNQSFYSLDEFTQHNREKHERCHVCDRISSHSGLQDAQPRYFVNYDELWRHFQMEHYPCGAPECLEQKFVVFESEIDLKAHIMEVHMGRASKAELRDMRRVEVNFQYNTPGSGVGRRRREEERPAGDVDISTLPRDEQAYYRIQQAQREMASRQIGNITIPPVRPRAAGDVFPPLAAASAAPTTETSTVPVRRPVDNFPPLGGTRSAPPTAAPAPQPPTSRLPPEVAARHAAVLEKAAQLLNNDPEKITQFKSQVSSFRRSDSTPTELIDTLWDIFNAPRDEFSKLITSTADLFDYDAKEKRTELLGAWHDWKVQVVPHFFFANRQMQAADSAASSGFLPQPSQRSRILLLKSSAKGRPSANTQSAQNVWNRIEAVAASRPVPSALVTQRLGAMHLNPTTRPAVPWTGTSTPAPRPSTVVRQPQPQRTVRNTSIDDFPLLPASKPRERVTLNAAAIQPRSVAGWAAPAESSNVPETTEVMKGKSKKKGKTILFHVG